ncbi:MAG: hypothetical protein COB66_07645 [Coxiella sp. (in: Bacteria)]|nr:MAG: hypothetical protein COB66_07645 [Coxiella sp. (in: g-proteobacteria)]
MTHKIVRTLSIASVLAVLCGAQAAPLDPSNVMGAKTCAACHKSETATWKKTKHYANFKKLSKNPQAKKIAKAMGVKRIRSPKADCAVCHYTVQRKGKKEKVISGTSCESCHGAAKNWIKIHSKKGGLTKAKGMIDGKMAISGCTRCHNGDNAPDRAALLKAGHPKFGDFKWPERVKQIQHFRTGAPQKLSPEDVKTIDAFMKKS